MYSNTKRLENSYQNDNLTNGTNSNESSYNNIDIDSHEDQNEYWDDYFERHGRSKKTNKRYDNGRYDDNEL